MLLQKRTKLAALMSLTLPVVATAEGEVRLEDVSVISASGYEQNLKDASASMAVIDQQQMGRKPVRDLGEIIESIPGVDVNANASSGNQNFSIRGFGMDYTLILIDGKRQNAANGFFTDGMGSTASSFIPPASMIERVEVIKGPASTLYGSDAVGGVINIITKRHRDQASGSITLESQIQQDPDLYGNRYGINGYFSLPLTKDSLSLDFRFKGNKKNAGDLRDPDGYKNWNAKTKSSSFGARLNQIINSANSVYIDFERNIDSPKLQSYNKRGGSYFKYTFKKDTAVINHDGEYDFGSINSYLQYNHIWNNKFFKGIDSKIYNAQSKAVLPFDFGENGSLISTIGIAVEHEQLKTRKGSRNYSFPGVKKQTTTALFNENEYYIRDNLILTAGLRYVHSDLFGSMFTPRAYLVWHLNDQATLKGGISKGYKTPSARDLNDGFSDHGSRTVVFGNPELVPEESTNYELGVDVGLFNAGRLSATAFLIDFENKLHRESLVGKIDGITCVTSKNWNLPDGIEHSCRRNINLDKTQTRGLELGFKSKKFNGFHVDASYTWMEQKYKSGKNDGKRIEELPKHVASVKLNYEQGRLNTFFKARARLDTLAGRRNKSKNFTKYRDFYVFDLGGSYQIDKNQTINIVLGNVFDTNFYRPFLDAKSKRYKNAYQDYSVGRNLWISYRYDF